MFVGSLIGCTIVFSVLANLSATLYNGYKTRKSADEQREKQEKFQLQTQQTSREDNLRLQREIRELNAAEARANQDRNFEHQRLQMEAKSAVASWPLLIEPESQLNRFAKIRKQGKLVPLQVFIVEDATLTIPCHQDFYATLRTVEQQLVREMGKLYNRSGNFPMEIHTQSLKFPATFFGESHISNIFSLYSEIPTVILSVGIYGGHYVIECTYWGIGEITNPQYTRICNLDLHGLDILHMSRLEHSPGGSQIIPKIVFQEFSEKMAFDYPDPEIKENAQITKAIYKAFLLTEIKDKYNQVNKILAAARAEVLASVTKDILKFWLPTIADVYYLANGKKLQEQSIVSQNEKDYYTDARIKFKLLANSIEEHKNFSVSQVEQLDAVAESLFSIARELLTADFFGRHGVDQITT